MATVLTGDWPAGTKVSVERRGSITFHTGWKPSRLSLTNVRSAEVVTADKRWSFGRKSAWGLAGLVTIGPLAGLAGVIAGGNMKEQVVAVAFRDGRKVILQGKKKELEPILVVGFDWNGLSGAGPHPNLPSGPNESSLGSDLNSAAPTPPASTRFVWNSRPVVVCFALLIGAVAVWQGLAQHKNSAVSPDTSRLLTSASTSNTSQPSPAPLTQEEVRELQSLLKAAGYDPGPVDGIAGPMAERAALRYLEARGSPTSGGLTRELLSRLKAEQPARSGGGGFRINGSQGIFFFVVIDKQQAKNQNTYRLAVSEVCGNKPICQVLFWVEGTLAPKALPMSDAQVSTKAAHWEYNANTGLRSFRWSCKMFPATHANECL